MGTPEDCGRLTDKMGLSLDMKDAEGGLVHLTGDGTAGAGGSVDGARRFWVAVKTV